MRMKSVVPITTTVILATCNTGLSLLAQSAVSGPTSGYAFVAGGFRPILGIPGSAHLGLPNSHAAQFARVAPNGISAITAGENGVQFIADLGQLAAVQLEKAITPTNVFWSPDSSAAALYSSEAQELQFSTLQSPTGRMKPPIHLNELGVVGAPLAVNPTAGLAAVCSNTILAIVGMQGLMTTSVNCDGLSAGVFASSTTLYVAGNGRVLEIENWQNGGTVKTLLENEGVQAVAAAVSNSPGGPLLLLADASNSRLYVYNTVTALETNRFDLDYAPSSLDLLGRGTFLLNRDRKPSDPLLVFQVLPQPAVTFVPTGE
jgi:hypothetical protein